jgi:hypothetical protein
MKLNSTKNEWLSETIKASARQGEGLEACGVPFKMLKELLANKVREREDWTGVLLYVDRTVVWSRHEVPSGWQPVGADEVERQTDNLPTLATNGREKNCASLFLTNGQ